MDKKIVIVCLWLLFCGSAVGQIDAVEKFTEGLQKVLYGEPCEPPTALDYASADIEPQSRGGIRNIARTLGRAKIQRYEQCLEEQDRRARIRLLNAQAEAIKQSMQTSPDYEIYPTLISNHGKLRKLINSCSDLGKLEMIRSYVEGVNLNDLRSALDSYGYIEFSGCPSGVTDPGIKELRIRSVPDNSQVRFTPLYSGLGEGHWISNNMDSGHLIKLEDGSLWLISPIDRVDTSIWLVTEQITVIVGDNPVYPYKLINTDTEEVAEAKLLPR